MSLSLCIAFRISFTISFSISPFLFQLSSSRSHSVLFILIVKSSPIFPPSFFWLLLVVHASFLWTVYPSLYVYTKRYVVYGCRKEVLHNFADFVLFCRLERLQFWENSRLQSLLTNKIIKIWRAIYCTRNFSRVRLQIFLWMNEYRSQDDFSYILIQSFWAVNPQLPLLLFIHIRSHVFSVMLEEIKLSTQPFNLR